MSFSFVLVGGVGGAMCPLAGLDYIAWSAWGVWLSSVGIADSHQWFWDKACEEKWPTTFPKAYMLGFCQSVLGPGWLCVCRLLAWYGSSILQSPVEFYHTVFCFFERKKRRNSQMLFMRQRHSRGYAGPIQGLPWLLCVIKSCFKGQFLNFICTFCFGGNLVGYKESELPKCSYHNSKVFSEIVELRNSNYFCLIPS
jgi:hypothetical protein